ncbi:MAG TPA: helix-turn-helix domain-containing protein [Pseudonocardiaceae bacterium]|jgi:transcriptional regulator of acetoin/glycerol metabolism|nr:helix-turn-helix domain-containing protein [Pseudonocardiaceae bacterium]
MATAQRMPADDPGLARTRVKFLTADTVEADNVRQSILASWWRSRQFRVPADRIDLPYVCDQDMDTPLIHAAGPVLDRLGDQLDGQPISLILTDPAGIVLTQRTGDPDLHRHLESVALAPGFNYGEQFVGTNGIGTALEDGRPTHVFGHEHYAENLENLACAGAPIQHPISGKTIGAVDLTCWEKDAGQLLIALARTTAEQIKQALLTHSNMRELTLFQAYLRTCRRTTGIVMAFNDDVVMMNDRARRLLDPADQAVLLGHATQALAEGRGTNTTVALPTGSKVRLQCRRVTGDNRGDIAGGVLSVKLIETENEGNDTPAPMMPMFLPGVVGSAPLWLRCCYDVDASYGRGEWLVLAGERGVGKFTLARCVHQRRNPTGRVHSLDAEDVVEADWGENLERELLDDPVDALVIRHVDRLAGDALKTLVKVLQEVTDRRDVKLPWVAVTLTSDAETNQELAELLAFFPRTVQVPPLRRHAEDMSELVPLFLNKVGHGSQLTCSPAAIHLLMRASWPGNIAQLYQVLKQIAQHRRTGSIQPGDLPAEYRTVTRRPLNRLESMERDAIVHSLEDAAGNKVRAAQFLGMSRATLYRKIHEYGIVTPDR